MNISVVDTDKIHVRIIHMVKDVLINVAYM